MEDSEVENVLHETIETQKQGSFSELEEMMKNFDLQNASSDFEPENLEVGNQGDSENSQSTASSAENSEPKKKTYLDFVNPKLAISIFDVVASRSFSGIANLTNVVGHTSYKDFSLDADEKRAIEKPLAEYLGTLEIKIESKLTALLMIIAIIYGGKGFALFLANKDKSGESEPTKKDFSETLNNFTQNPKADSERYFQTGKKKGQLKPKYKK